ncbi:MAG: hypothetical protein RLP44_16375 [Aggregatilineales bacterium]
MGFEGLNNPNNSGKSKFPNIEDYASPPERKLGGCLTLLLFVIIVGSFINIFLFLVAYSQVSNLNDPYVNIGQTRVLLLCLGGLQFFPLIFGVGLWNYKRWGYQGLLVSYMLIAVINFLFGEYTQIALNLIGMGILIALVNPRYNALD